MANPAVDSQLQAIALGANLANQRRQAEFMRQQFNMQAGAQLMRQRQMDMQLRAQEFEMSQAIREQEAQMRDMPKFQMFQNSVAEYLNDPSGQVPFPSMPQLESRSLAVTASQTMQGLDQYSARARQAKALAESQKLQADLQTQQLDQLNTMVSELAKRGVQVPTGYAGVQNGQIVINPEAANAIRAEHSRIMGAEYSAEQAADRVKMLPKQYVDEDAVNEAMKAGDISRAEGASLLANITGKTATDRKNKVLLDTLQEQGLISTPERVTEAKQKIWAGKDAYAGNAQTVKSFESTLGAVKALDEAMSMVDQFEKKYGKGSLLKFTGPLNSREFDVRNRLKGIKGLNDADRSAALQIFNMIEEVVAAYRANRFGASLTSNELANMEKIVSNREREDYLPTIEAFRNTLSKGASRYIREKWYNPNVAIEDKRRFAPDLFETASVTETVTEQPVPVPGQSQDGWGTTSSGVRFRVKQ